MANAVNSVSKCLLLNRASYCVFRTLNISKAGYATKPVKKAAAGGARGSVGKKKTLQVETNAELLCTRLCGGNIYKEGEDPVLGKDEDYPDWLWKLKLEKGGVALEDLNQDDPKYWRRLKVLTMREKNKVRSKF